MPYYLQCKAASWYALTKLLHVSCVAAQEGACGLVAGKQDGALRLADSLAPSQEVKQRCLAAARWTHLCTQQQR
jgi:hypothetical protein